MIVSYRKLTVHYKIVAPNTAAIHDFETDLVYDGFSIVRAMTNKTKQRRHGVKVYPSNHLDFRDTDLIRIQGRDPFTTDVRETFGEVHPL